MKQQTMRLYTELKKTTVKTEKTRAGGSGTVSLGKRVTVNAASLTFDLCVLPLASFQLEQLHIENECGVWGDDSGVACCSISHVWCAGDFSPLAQAHLCYSFFPALDDLIMANLELKGLVPVSRGVELFPVLQHTCQRNILRNFRGKIRTQKYTLTLGVFFMGTVNPLL